MTETLVNTLSSVEAEILVDSLDYMVFDGDPETLRNTQAL